MKIDLTKVDHKSAYSKKRKKPSDRQINEGKQPGMYKLFASTPYETIFKG